MISPNNKLVNWFLFVLISLIWGSSFILMKKGMFNTMGQPTLSAFHVAAIRILSAGLVLLPIAILQIRKIPKGNGRYIIISALVGGFIPAFLFCIAETKIDSSLAGFLNALTPVFTIIVGLLFFDSAIQKKRMLGVAIAFLGMLILFLANQPLNFQYLAYAGFVLVATICYAFNVNIVSRYLKETGSINIAAFGFGVMIIPSLLVLVFTGFFKLPLQQHDFLVSSLFSITLGVMGTAVASILFYMLLKRAGTLFTSMVTYGMPFVALGWGLLDGEGVNALQVLGLGVILGGVYLTNRQS